MRRIEEKHVVEFGRRGPVDSLRAASGVWYRALLAAMGHVIVDVARLMVEQALVLTLETWQVQLPRPALRKILRSRPTFNAAEYRTSKQRLNNLVPVWTRARAPWNPLTETNAFIGSRHPTNRVIRLDEGPTSDSRLNVRDWSRLRQNGYQRYASIITN